jgi:hypothetical protein
MPINLSDLKKDERTCTVDFGEESGEVTYRPSAYTPETEDAYQREIEKRRPSGGAADLVSRLVISWDVIDDHGEQVPVSLEILRGMPSEFLFSVIAAIIKDLNTKRDDRKNSEDGLPRAASRAKGRSGTRSSGRRGSLG